MGALTGVVALALLVVVPSMGSLFSLAERGRLAHLQNRRARRAGLSLRGALRPMPTVAVLLAAALLAAVAFLDV